MKYSAIYLLASDTDRPHKAPAALSWRPWEAFGHDLARDTYKSTKIIETRISVSTLSIKITFLILKYDFRKAQILYGLKEIKQAFRLKIQKIPEIYKSKFKSWNAIFKFEKITTFYISFLL